jgi:hypothetical protein
MSSDLTRRIMTEWNPLPPPAPKPLTPHPTQDKVPAFYNHDEAEAKVEEPASLPVQTKSARINPDNPKVLILALFLVFVLMVSSFIVSFFGIWGISQETTNIPDPITWLPALFLDAAILAYTISYFVFKYRGEPTGKTLTALWVFALLSVAANVVHTLEGFAPGTSILSMAVGIAITGSAPIAVVVAAEEIARLAFEDPTRKRKSKAV